MILCDNGHTEVAFEGAWGQDCPACQLAEETREELQAEIDRLQEEINNHDCEQEKISA